MSQGNSTVFADGISQGSSRHLNLSPYDFVLFVGKRFHKVQCVDVYLVPFLIFCGQYFGAYACSFLSVDCQIA